MHASKGFVASWPHFMVQDPARTLLRLLGRKGGRTKEDKKSPFLPAEPDPSKQASWSSHTSPAMSNFPELTCMIAPSYRETGKCNFFLGNIPSLDCSKLGQLEEEWEGSLVLSLKKKAENLTLSNIWVCCLITAEHVRGGGGGQECAWKLRNPLPLVQCLAQNRWTVFSFLIRQICRWHHPYGRKLRGIKGPLMNVKEESEKANLKFNIQKTKVMASGPITSRHRDGEIIETMTCFIFLGSKITVDGDCSHEIKRCLLLGRKAMTNI